MQVRRVLSAEQFRLLVQLNPNVMRQRWLPRRVQVKLPAPPAASEKAAPQP
jgi:hypothetical protein